jgi:hypothetical protein
LGQGLYRHVIEQVERHRRPGQVIEPTIHTNASLIDPDDPCGHGPHVGWE